MDLGIKVFRNRVLLKGVTYRSILNNEQIATFYEIIGLKREGLLWQKAERILYSKFSMV